MITGLSYRTVAAAFEGRDFRTRGGCVMDWDAYLQEHGYAVSRLLHFDRVRERERGGVWPPVPWTAVHLCEVVVPGARIGHMVVMLGDGTVLDPLCPEPMRLSAYDTVHSVAAVVKVKTEKEIAPVCSDCPKSSGLKQRTACLTTTASAPGCTGIAG